MLLLGGAVSYMGILGGIDVEFSANYGWQTVFNAIGALAIAVPAFGLPNAILLRIFNNIFGSVYTWLFEPAFPL